MEFTGFIFLTQLVVFIYFVLWREFKGLINENFSLTWSDFFVNLVVVSICFSIGKGITMLYPDLAFAYVLSVQSIVFFIHWIIVLGSVFVKLGVLTKEKFDYFLKR